MTQASEQRLFEIISEFREEQAAFNATMQSEFKQIKSTVKETSKTVGEHEAIKDRAVGAMWLSGILGGTGILAWLYSLIKH